MLSLPKGIHAHRKLLSIEPWRAALIEEKRPEVIPMFFLIPENRNDLMPDTLLDKKQKLHYSPAFPGSVIGLEDGTGFQTFIRPGILFLPEISYQVRFMIDCQSVPENRTGLVPMALRAPKEDIVYIKPFHDNSEIVVEDMGLHCEATVRVPAQLLYSSSCRHKVRPDYALDLIPDSLRILRVKEIFGRPEIHRHLLYQSQEDLLMVIMSKRMKRKRASQWIPNEMDNGLIIMADFRVKFL